MDADLPAADGLFAYYVSDIVAAALGIVWVAGRVWYMVGYTKAAEKRGPGFGVQATRLRRPAPRRAGRYRQCADAWRLGQTRVASHRLSASDPKNPLNADPLSRPTGRRADENAALARGRRDLRRA